MNRQVVTSFIACVLTMTLLVATPAAASTETDAPARLALVQTARESIARPGTIDIELDPEAYERLWNQGRARVESFPLPDGEMVDLDLEAFQVVAPDAVFVNVDESGEHRTGAPPIRFVRGSVVGDVDSLVVFSLFQNRIAGFVRTRYDEYGVGPRDFSIYGKRALDMQVWKRDVEEGSWDCSTEDDEALPADPALDGWSDPTRPLAPAAAIGGPQLLLEMAVETTTEWCAHFADDATAAQNYVLATVAQISAIYDAEVSVLVQVPFLRTFCGTADPYTDGLTSLADRSTLLDEVEAEWSANMGGVSRTVTHLFTHNSASGSAGGLANTVICSGSCVSVLCSTANGYAVNMFPATGGAPATFEISVAAHELGHNHSSPHTNCLQDGGGAWLSTCAINTCGLNPWCQATGCFPGPVDTAITGTLMSTGCSSRVSEFDDNVVESILRGAAEAATCVGAAGLPGESLGLRVNRVQSCPSETFQNDDDSLNSLFTGPTTWVKRFTPSCYPFELTRMDVLIPDFGALVGSPLRIMVYTDPTGSGDPANSTLVYSEDTTIQVVSNSTFNEYTLASPVTLSSGDFYIGFFDPLGTETMIARDTSTFGDSYYSFSTDPSGFVFDSSRTMMIRGRGGPVPDGSLLLDWDPPCNDASTPGQDFAVYRGDIGVPGVYTNLTCSTNQALNYFGGAAQDDSYYLVVPHTSPSEGSYGLTSEGLQRPAATTPCKPQNLETCP